MRPCVASTASRQNRATRSTRGGHSGSMKHGTKRTAAGRETPATGDRSGLERHCLGMAFCVLVFATLGVCCCSADAQSYAGSVSRGPTLEIPPSTGLRWSRVEVDGFVVHDACSDEARPGRPSVTPQGGLRVRLPAGLRRPSSVRAWGRAHCTAPLKLLAATDDARWRGPSDAPTLTLVPRRPRLRCVRAAAG